MRSLLLAVVLALASSTSSGCASPETLAEDGWQFERASAHPALVPGAELTTWSRGRGSARERQSGVRVDGRDVVIASLPDLVPYCRQPADRESAQAYADLAHRFRLSDLPMVGYPIVADETLDRPGVSGRYGRLDANAWGILFPPEAREYGGGFEVASVILAPPKTDEILGFTSPWRLLYVRQGVYPDGSIELLSDKTLTNGDDAARYAPF